MNISKLVQRLEEIENHTSGEGAELINSLIEELIEIDLRLEKGFKEVLTKHKDDFIDQLFKEGIEDGIIGEA
tara:strand:+ start:480 stop:695 length:216 start_codon:yes stop_codon:yes gene_type:complete